MASKTKTTSLRMSLAQDRAYMLPPDVHQIEVLSGGAWVSLGPDDVVVRHHEAIQLHPKRQRVMVTPLGEERLEFVMRVS